MCYIGGLGFHDFQLISQAGLAWLECGALARFRWLVHAFSTRRGGVSRGVARGLNLGMTAYDRASHVRENRRQFFKRVGAEDFGLATLRQIHSTHIYRVARGSRGTLQFSLAGLAQSEELKNPAPVGDALFTDEPDILLSVRVADCLPVLLVDPRRRAVAAVHVGWRGALARLAEKTVGVMRQVLGSDPRQLRAAVGPGIRACCYEVGEEVVEAFCGRFTRGERFFRMSSPGRKRPVATTEPTLPLWNQPPGHAAPRAPAAHLDLVEVTKDQLRAAGLRASHIHVADFCTACRTDLFFSHRKEGARTGRMMAVIGIRQVRS